MVFRQRNSYSAVVLLLLPIIAIAQTKAFPTAYGFAKNATGGRGGSIIHVTSLAESGAGTFRAAMETTGDRIIVFDVGGNITWTGERYIADGNVTILGQTAPSPGITITGHTLGLRDSNIIMRYLRVRVNDEVGGVEADGNIDGIRIINNVSNSTISNIIVDHCDVSLGTDENMGISGNSQGATNAYISDVTIQNCLNTDAMGEYDYAMLIGLNIDNLSIIRNGFFNVGNRVPEHTYGDGSLGLEFVNNILYNYNRPVTLGFGDSEFDSVGNVFKADSDYPPSQADHVYQLNNFENPSGVVTDGKVHQSDNIQIGSSSYGIMNSNWSSVNQASRVAASDYVPIPSVNVVDSLLYDLGASVVFADAIAAMRIDEFENSTGQRNYANVAAAGGVPALTPTNRNASEDSDNDDMLDAWEITAFGSITATNDPNGDYLGYGYDNIEYTSFVPTGELSLLGVQTSLPSFSIKKTIPILINN